MFLKFVVLAVVDIFAIQLALVLGTRISVFLGIGIAIFTILVNIAFLDDRLYAWRWVSPAMAGMFLLVVYPIGYTVSVAFTNQGDGHMLSKEQVLDQWKNDPNDYFAPPDSITYKTYVFSRQTDNPQPADFRFWLVDPNGKTFVGSATEQGLHEVASTDTTYGERDAKNIPKALGEFVQVPPQKFSTRLQGLAIVDPPDQIRLTKMLLLEQVFESQRLRQRFIYDAATNTVTDAQTGKLFRRNAGNLFRRVATKLHR